MASERTKFSQWKKVLYEKQDYPDNYVAPTFLKDLRKNVNTRYFSLKEIIVNAGVITQEITSIVNFLVVFLHLYTNVYTSVVVCLFIGITTLLLYVMLMLSFKNDIQDHLKNAFIFLLGGFMVSPILKTLTETISTDTIYTMVTLMMIAHLVFYDYGAEVAIVSRSISLNAAIFGAVCLASQLSTSYHAFALLTFATDIFVLFSSLRRNLQEHSRTLLQCLMTAFLTISSLVSLNAAAGLFYAAMLFLVLVFVNIIFPCMFYILQFRKENIYGPWDEAVIRKSTIDTELLKKRL